MKKILVLALLISTSNAFSQNLQTEINDHVWKPFIRAQLDLKEEDYLQIHSFEIIRAERTNKQVYCYDEYARKIHQGFNQALEAKKNGSKIEFSVELRFLERVASEKLAYEIGYYKSKLTLPSGKEIIYYSEFHVSLRKEGTHWKILTDSSLPLPDLTEDLFQKAKPMDI